MIRNCVGCGVSFETTDSRKVRCIKDCGRSTQSRNKARSESRELKNFIGVDGEGVTYCANCGIVRGESGVCESCNEANWKHDYVLLTVGNKPLYRDDEGPLHWREIFFFLYTEFCNNPSAAFVGFFLGYDFTNWLKTLPENRARSLLTKDGIAKRNRKKSGGNPVPFPVYLGEYQWELDILGLKRIKIRPGTGMPPGEIKNPYPWMTVCDAGSFFQTRFTSVIKSMVGDLITQKEYDTVCEGKSRRSTAKLDNDMMEYNRLENEILGRVMKQLNEGFKDAGIKLTKDQWFGPGQAAQAWLDQIEAPTGELVRKTIPHYALEAGRKTYFGGWFEIFRHGCVPDISYEYDINSAYPFIISGLPCLLHGTWKTHAFDTPHELKPDNSVLRMLHGVASGNDRYVGALLHRTPEGRVMRPKKTSGWYWEHEIEAGKRAGVIQSFVCDEYVEYEPCKCAPPFESIAELYQLRLQVGKESSRGKAYKLIYNSAYGKMAQSIGNPKYSNAIYASLITAGCRTMILDAIASHPRKTKDLLMVATDGVYFRSPHPTLNLHPETLGAWGSKEKINLTLFMPGIYWDDSSRDSIKQGSDVKLKSRGISAGDLASCIETIDAQFNQMKKGDEWPSVELPIKFNVITAVLALARNKWDTCGKVILDGTKKLNSNPKTKRNPDMWPDPEGERVILSLPYNEGPQLESTPYEKRFGDELEVIIMEEEVTQDGVISHDFTEMLGLK